MADDSPRLTIAIPTYNRREEVGAALESLARQRFGRFECIVVDNGPSTDGTRRLVEELAARDRRFRYMGMGPEGCIVARNAGFEAGTGELLMTLDDDVELPDPGTLGYVVGRFDENAGLGVLGLSEYYPGGKGKGAAVERAAPPGWRASLRDTTLHPPGRISRWGAIGSRLHHLPFGRLHQVEHVRSSAMTIRREAFQAVGGFEEAYTAQGYGYRYETELCVRIRRRGWDIVYSAMEPQAYHKAAPRPRGWDRSVRGRDYLYYTNRNNTLFFLRNYWGLLTGWIFLAWDVAVGSTTQPGLLRLWLQERDARRKLRPTLAGKWAGFRMFHGRTEREKGAR